MSIEEAMNAAWKEQRHKPNKMAGMSYTDFFDGFRAGAEWGRREALKEMCHDSDFDECQDGDWFWVLTDRGWNEAMKIGDGFEVITARGDCQFTCCREDVKRIVYVTLPSPAEAFGEGV